ncbi:hypothetical protein FD754_002476 [Muntiacus muntjak]|uniref:Small integral membrane protein 20 n=1 Tax=Muntiacus muntjak TaxID=9888 RepID=A0A5N3W9E3_MUNMU|nr:hypothetical protein FD754_002476 [Muntiacus muntjak]
MSDKSEENTHLLSKSGSKGIVTKCQKIERVPGTRRIQVAPAGAVSRNLRTALIFSGFISLIGAAFYPIYFRSLMWLEEYKKEQAVNRAGIVQEGMQPPGLKVWSDPFGQK